MTIINELTLTIQFNCGKYILPFCFKNETGRRTRHHLVFVSKHIKGYEIMKEIMAKESSSTEQGVPSFVYNPADKRFSLLFELNRPLDDLEEMLLSEFEGKTLSMIKIYETHNVGTPYIKKNYKDALNSLETKGKIIADPPMENRPKRGGEITFADHVLATFPPKGD